jgi:hypothetical protein
MTKRIDCPFCTKFTVHTTPITHEAGIGLMAQHLIMHIQAIDTLGHIINEAVRKMVTGRPKD